MIHIGDCYTDTIQTIKQKFTDKEGMPIVRQRLIWMGKTLEDDKRICDYDIPKESTLEMNLGAVNEVDIIIQTGSNNVYNHVQGRFGVKDDDTIKDLKERICADIYLDEDYYHLSKIFDIWMNGKRFDDVLNIKKDVFSTFTINRFYRIVTFELKTKDGKVWYLDYDKSDAPYTKKCQLLVSGYLRDSEIKSNQIYPDEVKLMIQSCFY